MHGYRILGLDPAPFERYWRMDETSLQEHGARRVVADDDRGYPCRISLQDACCGEPVLLLNWPHHDVASPYRASGPIFVRQVREPAELRNRVPDSFLRRQLSLRAYSAAGDMLAADTLPGGDLEAAIEAFLADREVAYLHAHNARRGCYAARIERIR